MPLLEVQDVHVSFPTADGLVQAVRGLSFQVDAGQTLGVVGESGSGKSVSTQTVVGLTTGARVSGRALFEGRDLLTMSPSDLRAVRGAQIAMIFQDPLTSLHPHYRVGSQIVEMIRAHEKVSKSAARARAIELLQLVGIPSPNTRVDNYPHQFSGGMRQRAMIAMAMALNPKLLVADEPTTALDVTVQAQVMEVVSRLQENFGTALIMITHDLGVVAGITDTVMVMYAGKGVEYADRRTTYYSPHHPYTRGLLASLPKPGSSEERLLSIAGAPPSLIHVPSGCPFHPRCPFVMERCLHEEPPLRAVAGSTEHRSACWLPDDLTGMGADVDERRLAFAADHRGERAQSVVAALAAEGDGEMVLGAAGAESGGTP